LCGYIYTHTNTRTRTHEHTQQTYTHTYTHPHTHTHMNTMSLAHAHTQYHVYTCMHTHIYTHVHVYTGGSRGNSSDGAGDSGCNSGGSNNICSRNSVNARSDGSSSGSNRCTDAGYHTSHRKWGREGQTGGIYRSREVISVSIVCLCVCLCLHVHRKCCLQKTRFACNISFCPYLTIWHGKKRCCRRIKPFEDSMSNRLPLFDTMSNRLPLFDTGIVFIVRHLQLHRAGTMLRIICTIRTASSVRVRRARLHLIRWPLSAKGFRSLSFSPSLCNYKYTCGPKKLYWTAFNTKSGLEKVSFQDCFSYICVCACVCVLNVCVRVYVFGCNKGGKGGYTHL